MTDSGTELRGPVDFVLIEYPGDKLTGALQRLSSSSWIAASSTSTT
jgi:hypothetical protein